MPLVREDERVTEVFEEDDPREPSRDEPAGHHPVTAGSEALSAEPAEEDSEAESSDNESDQGPKSLEDAERLKEEGNEHYKAKRIELAMNRYTLAYSTCPREEKVFRSQCLANRAACHYYFSEWDDVVEDCTKALKLNRSYLKVLLRRASAYEELKKYGQCEEDLDEVQKLDPSWIGKPANRARYDKIAKAAEEQFEREKAEMMDKLKDLGNTVLGKFGLSTDNFKCVKDPTTGSYSISFQQ
uniref:Tetratricopeptide repeat protein n=1 Tax=Perkinsus chesapeaki TaxID=330153 RepID=A7YXM9_PERCH|nr:tetratricopeptide repeat protein [Perkinsus chesapeaki]